MTKKISAKHPIWNILNRYQQKMLAAVKIKADQDAIAEMAALGSRRTEEVAAKSADIGWKIMHLQNLQATLTDPITADLLDDYAVRRTKESAAAQVKELQKLNPAVEVLTKAEREAIKAKYSDWAKAESERISDLFDAIQIKISLDDAVDEVLKVLADAGIKLPDVAEVKALPLALDETIPTAGDTKVTVNNDVHTG